MNLTNKIGLGSVQFGIPYGVSNVDGQTTKEEVQTILELAIKNDVKLIDTASAYGEAEEVLGCFDLSQFNVVSKFMPSSEKGTLEKQFELSLQRLNLKSLYGYLAHRPLDVIENPSQWETLQKLKQEDKLKKIGFSLNTPNELENLISEGFIPDLVQVPYNYFDRRFENSMIELKKNGCEIHTRSTFLQGLFFMNTKELSSFFNEVKPYLNKLQKNDLLAKSLLKFSLNKSFIDKVIIGVENSIQFLDNLNMTSEVENLQDFDYNFSNKILMPMFWPK